ncbi:molybdopterin molybdotransferase MoeA [Pseudogemmobacter faecipullorum]|uniref:Molybdopterin molybdenumtransferase n=1 Tax=Pseudogemmobacter faecipullorum TaxID=2755041 RepID=A0ABS8CM85_9RHOB|nr:gephyrin-like molybdotransferase Glp [Pseudogemmobacter faecipullorum]MCB5410506.1 molybdopterin molybdotransferase MoeA [Pseudogemmobacter faecipullorum]
MMPVDEAMARIMALAPELAHEEIPLAAAAGRWLARAVTAERDQPPFDASAMDGYALACAPEPGARFRVIGEAGAGHAFTGVIGEGQAVRIFTGAPVPDGANHVTLQENTAPDGAFITITDRDSGSNIRPRGQDFRIGDQIGLRRLRPSDLALIASMNVAKVTVRRRPVVAILSTGDELVMPGESPRADQIIASNSFAIKAMAEAEGAETRLLPIARDTEPALRQVLELARGADVIVTSGGASVGDHDLVAPVAKSLGLEAGFWKVALRPGKPLMAGRLFGAAFLGLPGNPVSAILCAELFLLPLLRHMQGDPSPRPRLQQARLATDLPENGPRAHYMRAKVSPGGEITPFGRQDSALLTVLAEANALMVRPVGDPARQAGDLVDWIAL